MKLSDNDITKAIKISKELQDFFNNNPTTKVLRSTDAYEILVRKNLVETDRHSGVKFREFLKRLKNNDGLNFIPQCRIEGTSGSWTNWFFESTPKKSREQRNLIPLSQAVRIQTIDIEEIKNQIDKLPKRATEAFNFLELETRQNYSRAFEYWSATEEELLETVVKEITDSFELSKVFCRQPSAIQKRLKDKFGITI